MIITHQDRIDAARISALTDLLGGPIEPQVGEDIEFRVGHEKLSGEITQSDMDEAWRAFNNRLNENGPCMIHGAMNCVSCDGDAQ